MAAHKGAGTLGVAGRVRRPRPGSVLSAFTWRSLRGNRVRTAVTIVGIALACALFLAVCISAQSVYLYLGDTARATSGAYNGAAGDANAAFVAQAERTPGVTQVAWLADEGYAKVNTPSTITPYLHVVGMSSESDAAQTFAELTALNLTAGRMPQSPDEVIVPQSLVDSGSVEARLGEELTLQVGTRQSSTGERLGWSDLTQQPECGAGIAEELVDTEERAFTVVGFYADSPALMYIAGIAGSYMAGYPAITVADFAADSSAVDPGASLAAGSEASNATSYKVWLTVRDPATTLTVLGGIAQSSGAPLGFGEASAPASSGAATAGDASVPSARTLYENANVNRMTSFSLDRGVYLTMIELAGVVCVIVVVASALLIRNAFAVSVTQRTRQFGLLSSVGATPRQLRGLVLREALTIDLIAIPLGVVVGYAGAAAVLTAARGVIADGLARGAGDAVAFKVAVSPVLVVVAVALALVTTLLSAWGPARRASRMTAIDAIRSASDVRVPAGVRRGGRIMGRLFGMSGLLAARSFRRDARPRRAITASLVTAVVLVVTATLLGTYSGAFLSAVTPGASGEFGSGPDLEYTFTESNVDADDADLTPQAIAERLGQAAGVDGSAYGLTLPSTLLRIGEGATPSDAFDPDYLAQTPAGMMFADVQFVDDASYRAWLEEVGLPADELMDAGRPRAVAVNTLRSNDGSRYGVLAPFSRAGFTASAYESVFGSQTDALAGGTGDAGSAALAGAAGLTGGAALDPDLVMPLGETPGDALGEEGPAGSYAAESVIALPFEVGALSDEVPWWVGVPEAPVFLLPLSALPTVAPLMADATYERLFSMRSWDVWFQAADNATAQTSITGVLQDVGLSPARLTNWSAQEAATESNNAMVQVFLWAFAVIVTLIALTGAFNAMYTSVTLRRRELAMLRSCGLTQAGVRGELLCECALYTGRVALWSVPVTLFVSLAMWRALGATMAGAPYAIPWGVVPALLVVLLVTLGAGLLALRSSRGDDLVAILRTEAV